MGKETEAQKRASRKYYLTQKLRDEYKQRIDEAVEILERDYHIKGEDRDLYETLTGKKVWESKNE